MNSRNISGTQDPKSPKGGPIIIKVGGVRVPIYRRQRGKYLAFEVADYSGGTRRLRSFANEEDARNEALRIARMTAAGQSAGVSMSAAQRASYGRATELLKPSGLSLEVAAATVADACAILGGNFILEAARDYVRRHAKITESRTVREVVDELLVTKKDRQGSVRYLADLRSRLGRFAEAFAVPIGTVSTPHIQRWLDGLNLAPQTYKNFRTVLRTLFEFASARGYAAENPVAGTEVVKTRSAEKPIFTAGEMARLLAAAERTNTMFLPVLLLGGFAGLRSAEIERLRWENIDLPHGVIVIGADKAKTATRRIVPIAENLAAWLRPWTNQRGLVWGAGHDALYDAQQACADETEDDGRGLPPVKWKANGLRSSYASYRFALIQDAGRVAAEMGNSAQVIHRHYRELVKPSEAENWFSLAPAKENVAVPTPMQVVA